jgi:hypothetical protein
MKNILTLALGWGFLLSSLAFQDSKIALGLNGIALGIFIVNLINLVVEDLPKNNKK